MQKLNFPNFSFRFKNSENKREVFDPIRKKFIQLTPEEWVRQNVVAYLNLVLGYPLSYINVEKKITINGLTRRYDVVVFNTNGGIEILVECKAPEVSISQEVFDQAARYNLTLQSKFLMVTNGLQHYFCTMDYEKKSYVFLKELPKYLPHER